MEDSTQCSLPFRSSFSASAMTDGSARAETFLRRGANILARTSGRSSSPTMAQTQTIVLDRSPPGGNSRWNKPYSHRGRMSRSPMTLTHSPPHSSRPAKVNSATWNTTTTPAIFPARSCCSSACTCRSAVAWISSSTLLLSLIRCIVSDSIVPASSPILSPEYHRAQQNATFLSKRPPLSMTAGAFHVNPDEYGCGC